MDITEIDQQPLSVLLTTFYQCERCGVVDRDDERSRHGHLCARCGEPSAGGTLYFSMQVMALIDLMQEAFHAGRAVRSGSWRFPWSSDTNLRLAVVVYFTTLGEVLVLGFLRQRFKSLSTADALAAQLLNDNQTIDQRLTKLFPATTGEKWNDVIAALASDTGIDFLRADEFYRKARKARNLFLHEGDKWAVGEDMPAECLRQTEPLLALFGALHNRYELGS